MKGFKKEVTQLFSNSKNISEKRFSYKQLEGLPEPVQKYFRHVLKEGQPFISYVRLKHAGKFKIDEKKDWVNIKGEQYFSAEPPGFVWKGKIGIVSARDMFLFDKGRLVVTLLKALKIADKKGKSFDQGELYRWLGESVWFPTNLLPSKNLEWQSVDDHSAILIYNYKDIHLKYLVRFNEMFEIIEFETQRNFDEFQVKTWIGNCSNYQEVNGIKIPMNIKATWRLSKGDHTYANFEVSKIEYGIPEKF